VKKLATYLLIFSTLSAYAGVFDLDAIRTDPLAPVVLSSSETNGIVTEEIEFTSDHDLEGNPIRTFGILAYPKGGTNLPAVLWCQGGMADAGSYFPEWLARKGYMGLSITLPKKEWNAHGPFDAANPENANFVRLTVTHLRAVTYLEQRAEVAPERLGVGGASYGGVFSTLVAGIDPRIKVGMSFFSAGNHHLGTNLPQFNALKTAAEIEIFKQTADGARYHRERAVPFLWGVAANDNWFFFPAVIKTYEEALSPDSRIGICPSWTHGFPETFDNQLLDWFDVFLLKTRKPYNKPADLTIAKEGSKLIGRWNWTGDNRVKKAELVVSYGRVLPWHGWVHRLHHPIPATIEGASAYAEIPVPEPGLELLAYGSLLDENDVLISTLPATVTPSTLGIAAATGRPSANGCPWGDLEGEVETIFRRHGYTFGVFDTTEKQAGAKSLRAEPPAEADGKRRPIVLKLHNVYERDHTLSLWAKADRPAKLDVEVKAILPRGWRLPAPRVLLADVEGAARLPDNAEPPVFAAKAAVDTAWKEFRVDCPFTGTPVAGYNLRIAFADGDPATYWIDSIAFTPQWKE